MAFKILHIIPNLSKGGAERLVLEICTALSSSANNEVLLITFGGANLYKNIYPTVDIKCIESSVSLSITGKNIYNIDALQKEIERFSPDIIHSHLFEAEMVSRSCYYPQAKWFSHTHDNMPAFQNFTLKTLLKKEQITRFYEKKYLFARYRKNGGNSFIAISRSSKEYFDKTASEFPVFLLPNAIRYNTFYVSHKKLAHTDTLRLVTVGSLNENKNQTFLIDVMKLLVEDGLPVELHVLGDGRLKPVLLEKINTLGLNKHVFLHGNVDHVERVLWESDMYLHSAKSEALGLTIIEAMAAGLPVVTLDGNGNRDLIEEGKNGYMIFDEDAAVFAAKIWALWRDKKLYSEMCANAQMFAKKYDINPYINNLMKIYKQA